MINKRERLIIRKLAQKVLEISSLPVMDERRELWKRHNSLQRVSPMVLVFPEGSWRELLPESVLQCEDETLRWIEWDLRHRIYQYEHFQDDKVVEKTIVISKEITNSGWGLETRHVQSSKQNGAWGFDPVIKKPGDLKKLKFPKLYYNEEVTSKRLEKVQDILDDILEIKLKGISHISFHMMSDYCQLRGLEQVMLDMYDEPDMLHEVMAFFEEGNKQLIQQYVELNLLSLNNDETYHSSGGNGYTAELPKPGYDTQRVRPCDMWASAESQEMAYISPEMHYEFVMQYEKRLLEPFGLNGYGCCEDLTRKLDYVFDIPNIRRISISPWADVEACAAKLKGNCIFSWKPNPAHLVGGFDTGKIEEYVKRTLDLTKDCVIEIILKDTHTCENQPERFDRWTEVVRRLVSDATEKE